MLSDDTKAFSLQKQQCLQAVCMQLLSSLLVLSVLFIAYLRRAPASPHADPTVCNAGSLHCSHISTVYSSVGFAGVECIPHADQQNHNRIL